MRTSFRLSRQQVRRYPNQGLREMVVARASCNYIFLTLSRYYTNFFTGSNIDVCIYFRTHAQSFQSAKRYKSLFTFSIGNHHSKTCHMWTHSFPYTEISHKRTHSLPWAAHIKCPPMTTSTVL